MHKRVRQFFAAVTARISEQDRRFVNQHLTKAEQQLFWQMSVPDQRHALNVAYTAAKLAAQRPAANWETAVKSALLHDVGRRRGDMSVTDKVLAVLAHKLAPRWARQWAKEGRGGIIANLRHALYIYFNHAERSARLLETVGTQRAVVDAVRKHHSAPAPGDTPELNILREADDKH
ncbi:HDIG domain-containing metalloprotein [Sporolituus thermophilus]|uniref:HDIG domain-containing protein n=1 Tax=Sporolituus thermophilus DSM 23256 TaxID=1123285 RepID=A0A1G7KE36_9FIRM|nr:HDIG domain-containing metalloprotein [Sporolituus thermophilus]SDF35447.1 HDIG domain-containing protein [Sporolituus thermophilus DSM 23256]